MLAAALAAAACDVSVPLTDSGIDAGTRDVTYPDGFTPTDGARPESGSDATGIDAPVSTDGSGGGNTCADTASYCYANQQCCSGVCVPVAGGAGMCAAAGGDGGTWPAPDGGAACLMPCHCASNQNCCLNPSATAPCGVIQVCSVVQGCI